MNRPIKFRAWDKVQQHFVYFELGILDGKMWTTEPIHKNHILESWEQFTGLLDKNGKEIYEGDIGVRLDLDEKEQLDYPQLVVWREDIAGFTIHDVKVGTKQYEDLPEQLSWGFKVIGNIYENPELVSS